MIILLLAIHIMVAVALVGVILLQKSEGGALGMGGGGMSGFMTGRSTANLLTRATAILAAAFMMTSVLLVVMHTRQRAPVSLIDQPVPAAPARPAVPLVPGAPTTPAKAHPPTAPTKPAAPAQPSAPLAH
jgi:preprotein translocase subunit SecG